MSPERMGTFVVAAVVLLLVLLWLIW